MAGGHKEHYQELISSLRDKDIVALAGQLSLPVNENGEAVIPFLGATYTISDKGVKRTDDKKFLFIIGNALIHYLLMGASGQPSGKYVSINELAGPWLKDGGFSKSALEYPISKRFRRRVPELMNAAESIDGRKGGVSGQGSISFIFDLLPHIPVQLIFYDEDDEFSARTTLLADARSTEFIDFEALAFLLSVFVQYLINFKTEEQTP